MEKQQADKLLKFLIEAYNAHNQMNDIRRGIYLNFLSKAKHNQMIDAVNKLKDNETFFPQIAVLNKYYKQQYALINRREERKEDESLKCVWCNGKGYILERDEEERETIYHCTECSKGDKWKYKGWEKEEKRYKSDYYTRGINEIYDVKNHNKFILERQSQDAKVDRSKIQKQIEELKKKKNDGLK